LPFSADAALAADTATAQAAMEADKQTPHEASLPFPVGVAVVP